MVECRLSLAIFCIRIIGSQERTEPLHAQVRCDVGRVDAASVASISQGRMGAQSYRLGTHTEPPLQSIVRCR